MTTPETQARSWITPTNAFVLMLLVYVVVTRVKSMFLRRRAAQAPDVPPKLDFQTYTPETLQPYNGRDKENILLAINGRVYDVTLGGRFYGPNGPYGNFAGRDASRGLALGTFDADILTPVDEPIDELADLTDEQRSSLKEWQGHFEMKYPVVGVLQENERHRKS